jgi:antitoxin component YwqK of YwqJK toxin-antitoxin module
MKILPVIFITIFFTHCVDQKFLPPGIPSEAEFDKRKGLYTLYKDGKYFEYSEKGKLYLECEVNQQKLFHGKCKTYSMSTGIMLCEGNFKDNQRDGLWTWKFPDGNMYYKLTYAFGKKKSIWIDTYVIGNEDGPYERFYNNGDLDEKGSYDSGKRSGDWIKFYQNGKLEYKGTYKNDKKLGTWTYYYPDGKTEILENYDNAFNLISRTTYYPDGNINCVTKKDTSQAECNKITQVYNEHEKKSINH